MDIYPGFNGPHRRLAPYEQDEDKRHRGMAPSMIRDQQHLARDQAARVDGAFEFTKQGGLANPWGTKLYEPHNVTGGYVGNDKHNLWVMPRGIFMHGSNLEHPILIPGMPSPTL
jgi:hypothetical protein